VLRTWTDETRHPRSRSCGVYAARIHRVGPTLAVLYTLRGQTAACRVHIVPTKGKEKWVKQSGLDQLVSDYGSGIWRHRKGQQLVTHHYVDCVLRRPAVWQYRASDLYRSPFCVFWSGTDSSCYSVCNATEAAPGPKIATWLGSRIFWKIFASCWKFDSDLPSIDKETGARIFLEQI